MDLAGFRALFPALRRWAWLDTPSAAPGADPVLRALRYAQARWADGTFAWLEWEEEAEVSRGLFARLIGAEADSVGLTQSLAEAAAMVAACIPKGKVVVSEHEFRSNLFPWLALAQRGNEVVRLRHPDALVHTDDYLEAIDDRTVLVAISEVQSSNGRRVDLAPIAERCRAVGARIFVNLTQSLGVLPCDVAAHDLDFVAAHGYKWLLAPRGAAWLYVRNDRLGEVSPLIPSWKSGPDPHGTLYGGPYELAPRASRLDASLGWFAWVGARAALELVASLDPQAVAARSLGLAARFRTQATARGFDPVPEESPSQIVSLRMSDAERERDVLMAKDVRVSARAGYLRLGFHAFNDDSDVDRALDALSEGGTS